MFVSDVLGIVKSAGRGSDDTCVAGHILFQRYRNGHKYCSMSPSSRILSDIPRDTMRKRLVDTTRGPNRIYCLLLWRYEHHYGI